MLRSVFCLALLGGMLTTSTLSAQVRSDLTPGTRLRLRVANELPAVAQAWPRGWITGELETIDADYLVLTTSGPHAGRQLAVPREIVTKLELSRGIRSGPRAAWRAGWRGAADGAALGAVWVGALKVYDMANPDPPSAWGLLAPEPTAANALRYAGVGAVIGGVTAGIIGLIPHEEWERVPMVRAPNP